MKKETVSVRRYETGGKIDYLEILRQKRKLLGMQFVYGSDGFPREIEFEGKVMPTDAEVASLVLDVSRKPIAIETTAASTATDAASGSIDVDLGSTASLVTIEGAGRVLAIFVYSNSKEMAFKIYVDDVLLNLFDAWEYNRFSFFNSYRGTVQTSFLPFWTVMKYDTTNNVYSAVCTLPIEFKRKLELQAYNGDIELKIAKGTVTILKMA